MSVIERPRGTRDFRPEEMARRRAAEAIFRQTFESFAYREVQTPTFENLELFTLKSGPGVVNELYHFKDKGGRDLTLRPELTAPVLRFYVNELSHEPKPLKLYYHGNCFRYEEPQSGRYREFWQFGTEVIGPATPESDAEVIALAAHTLRRLGLQQFHVRVGHIGLLKSLAASLQLTDEERFRLFKIVDKDQFDEKRDDVREILAAHVADTAGMEDQLEFLAGAVGGPEVIEEARARIRDVPDFENVLKHMQEIGQFLQALGVDDFEYDLGVVRGLDYYTGMVFEIEAPVLGAEKQITGGGAYSLSELFGGEPVGSVGFGMGFDRILLALEREGGGPKPDHASDAFVIAIGDEARVEAMRVAADLRAQGLKVDADLMRRKPGKAFDYANAIGARYAIVLGKKELEQKSASLKDMRTGEQQTVALAQLAQALRGSNP